MEQAQAMMPDWEKMEELVLATPVTLAAAA
jgi:hypothetical protein